MPDGKTLICSRGKTFEWWNANTGIRERVLRHGLDAGEFSLSPDGRLLASVHGTGRLVLWDAESPSTVPVRVLLFEAGTLISVRFSPDGEAVAAGAKEGAVLVWDPNRDEPPHTILPHGTSWVTALAFSPDGKTLVSGGGEHVKLWDLTSKEEIATLDGHEGIVVSAAFSPDGKILATSGGHWSPVFGELMIWDVASRKRLAHWRGNLGPVRGAAFSSDGRLVTVGNGKEARIWTLHADSTEPVAARVP
jgi:WD40 repeat protein